MRKWGVLAAIALGRASYGLQFQSVAAAGPELAARFGVDYAGLGALLGVYMAAGIALSLPSGLLGRWLGERWVVGAGLALMAAGGTLAALSPGLGGIGWGRGLAGAGAVTLLVMQGKVIADCFAGRAFVAAMGVAVAAFPVGVGAASLLVGRFGWAGVAWAGVAPAALAALLFIAASGQQAAPGGARIAWPTGRECALVAIAGLVWTLFNGAYYAFLTYLPSWMAARGEAAGLTAGVMTAATWLNVPFILGGGALAARWGAGRIFVIGAAGLVAALAGPALADAPLLWGALFGTVGGMHAGIIVALGTLSARPANQAVGMGLFYTIFYLGSSLLPGLCGRAADLAGDPSGALLAGAALGLLSLPVFAAHRRLARQWS